MLTRVSKIRVGTSIGWIIRRTHGHTPKSREIVIPDDKVVQYLAESEGEDFIHSDSDMENPAFTMKCDDHDESDSSDTIETIQVTRGRARNRSSKARGRRRQLSLQNVSPIYNITPAEWIDKNFVVTENAMSEPPYIQNFDDNFDKFLFLGQYLDDSFLEQIIKYSNQTSVTLHGQSLNLDLNELYVYIGITFVMAALNYPWLRMYWETKWRVPIIADNMSRNRFTALRRSIKVVFDEDITEETRKKDKLWKVRPLIERIQQGCRLQGKEKRLSIGEMIIPFRGSCGIKQYCPGKLNPVGLKAFVLTNPNGLILDFQIYQGNITFPKLLEASEFSLSEKAVLFLSNSLVPGHVLYFNQYFTTVNLAKELLVRGIMCTGTIVKNRIPASARAILIKDEELIRRGSGSVHTVVCEDGTTAITKWNDNKPITLLSNIEAKEPMDVCQLWCQRTKRYISVNRPAVVRNYTTTMRGINLAERMLSVCPNRYRTKKWTQRLFSHMLDLAVSNSWLQYKRREIKKGVALSKIQQLRSFKMELGEGLIEMHTTVGEVASDSADLEPEIPLKRKKDLKYELIPSQRGNQLLVSEGFAYTQVRPDYWRCSSKSKNVKCNAMIRFKNGRIVRSNTNHCHPPRKRKENSEALEIKYEIGISQRGRRLLLIDGYAFSQIRKCYWICSNFINFEFVKSEKGGDLLISNGFTFSRCNPSYHPQFINIQGSKQLLMVQGFTFAKITARHWYCSKKAKGCKARVFLNSDGTVVDFCDNTHNHDPPVYKKCSTGQYVKLSG
ncbi:unnamed protein product, partial [Brenthis ino]